MKIKIESMERMEWVDGKNRCNIHINVDVGTGQLQCFDFFNDEQLEKFQASLQQIVEQIKNYKQKELNNAVNNTQKR